MVTRLTNELNLVKMGENEDAQLALEPYSQILSAQMEIAKFRRELLIKLHKESRFSDDVIRKIESEIDIEDMRLDVVVQKSKK